MNPYLLYIKWAVLVVFVLVLVGFGYHLGSNHYGPIIADLTEKVGAAKDAQTALSLSLEAQTQNAETAKKQADLALENSKAALAAARKSQQKALDEIAFYKREVADPRGRTCSQAVLEIKDNINVK